MNGFNSPIALRKKPGEIKAALIEASKHMEKTSPNTITSLIEAHIHRIAPESKIDQLDPQVDIGTALDFDSMDFYTLLVGLSEELEVEIPEESYGQLRSLAAIREFLLSHTK
jgi:acyl carrier protein